MKRSTDYQSSHGYLMRGGQERLPGRPRPVHWLSLGLLVGVALAVATYLVT